MDDYPVLDDDDYSTLEWEEASELWASLPVRERVELCQQHGVSIFAARHDWIPADDSGSLFDYLRG